MRILLLLTLLACGEKSQLGSVFSKEGTGTTEEVRPDDKFEAFMQVVEQRCMQCHYEGSILGRNFQEYRTPQDWIDSGDITPGRLDLSPSFYLIRGAGVFPDLEFVPSLNPSLKPEEIEVIRSFILEYDFESNR